MAKIGGPAAAVEIDLSEEPKGLVRDTVLEDLTRLARTRRQAESSEEPRVRKSLHFEARQSKCSESLEIQRVFVSHDVNHLTAV